MATTERIDRDALLTVARTIAQEYGGNLTLRQLYYQAVARGHSPNSQKDYCRLKDLLGDARLAGAFPFNWLIDRSRTVHNGSYDARSVNITGALEQAADDISYLPVWRLRADRWWGQSTHVSVFVEKEALAGVFERPCTSLGVSWFACKGYPSHSSLYDWVKKVERTVEESKSGDPLTDDEEKELATLDEDRAFGTLDADDAARRFELKARETQWDGIDKIVIIYFGDHDPDGLQIPESILSLVRQIASLEGIVLPTITLEKAALTREQIEEHKPVPFPAKKSSARFQKYAAEHPWTFDGSSYRSWELDALQPTQLDALIRAKVGEHFDRGTHRRIRAEIDAARDEMRAEMKTGTWMEDALARIPDGE